MARKLRIYTGAIGGQFLAKVAATSVDAARDALTKATGMKFTRHEMANYWGRGQDCEEASAEPGRVFVNLNGTNYPRIWGTYAEAREAEKLRREAQVQARRAMMAKE